MDVVCPRCHTEYEFDEQQIPSKGLTVQCTSCDHTFRIRTRAIVETEALDGSSDRQWMIRRTNGERLHFNELPTLQQWIVERRVEREDEISRSGQTWKRLGDIAELSSFFLVVDAATQSSTGERTRPIRPSSSEPSFRAPRAESASNAAGLSGGPAGPSQLGTTRTTDEDSEGYSIGSAPLSTRHAGPSAAWEVAAGQRVAADPGDSQEVFVPKRRRGLAISLTLLGVIVLASGLLFAFKPHLVAELFGKPAPTDSVDAPYRAGLALLEKDDRKSLEAANAELARSQAGALAFAARSQVAAILAQHLNDHAALLDLQAKQIESEISEKKLRGPAAGQLTDQANALRLRASRARTEAKAQIEQATAQANEAYRQDKTGLESNRALADARRLAGRPDPSILALIEAAKQVGPNDPGIAYVEGLYWLDQQNSERASELLHSAVAKARAYNNATLLRAVFQLALIAWRAGDKATAQTQLQAILAQNAAHQWAKTLRDLLPQTPKLIGSAPPASDAGTPSSPASQDATKAETPTALPTSYEDLVRAGDSAAEAGKTMRAIKAYEAALKRRPRGYQALTGLAYCQLDLERFGAAVAGFRRALNIEPSHGDALIGMAEAYKAMGDKQRSLDHYVAYLNRHPQGPKAALAQRNKKALEAALGLQSPSGSGGADGGAQPSPNTPAPDDQPTPTPPASDAPSPRSPSSDDTPEPSTATPPPATGESADPPAAPAAPAQNGDDERPPANPQSAD